jgi:CRP-like cAMP-binding protein
MSGMIEIKKFRTEAMDLSALSFLRHIPLFAHCTDDERVELAAAARELRVTKGTALFRRGDPCEGMHVLVYGRVSIVVVSKNGTEKVVELIQPGQSFGEAIMFLGGERYPVSAQTVEDALVLFLPAGAIFAVLDRDPRFARRMLAGLSMRLHGLLRDVESYTLESASDRVVTYLLQQLGEATSGTVILPVNKQLIASRLNLTPETFSRVLQRIVEQCDVVVSGREICISDRSRLAELLKSA